MAAGRYNPCIYQGSTFQRDVTYTDSDKVAVDLTSSIVRMQARARVDSITPVIDISTATTGITLTDAVNGKFQISLSAAETAALMFTTAVYDLEVEFPSGEVRKILEGTIELRKEVTR